MEVLMEAERPTEKSRRARVRAACTTAGTLAVVALLAGCIPDTSVIDARLAQAVQPATPPATGCAEACGITLRVTSPNGDGSDKVEYDSSLGTYNGDETVAIASASKWLAGAVLMSLVDSGLLSLDDTVGEFFPAHAGTPTGSITVAQLFSHTSGMDWNPHPCLGDSSVTLEACAAAILAVPLRAAPGAQFGYGGNSMQVAGRIAEIVSGTSWVNLSRARLITPLGLTHTGWFGNNPQVAGGAISSASDYDRFLGVIQRGGTAYGVTLLTPQAVAAMQADRISGVTVAYTPNPQTDGYGIGVWLDFEPGGVTVSSPGKFGMYPLIDSGRCYRSVLLQQSSFVYAYLQMQVIKPEIDRQLSCSR